MVRRFDGTDDELTCSIGGSNLTGALTIAVLIRPYADEGTFIQLRTSAAAEAIAWGINAAGSGRFYTTGGTLTAAEHGIALASGEWGLLVVTKPAGVSKPRWHVYAFNQEKWGHADDESTRENAVSQAGGTVRFGTGMAFGFAKFDIAVAATWTKVLSDAEVESLTSGSIMDWLVQVPAGLWMFDQPSVEASVLDLSGNGAHQSARTGTAALDEQPPIPYEEPPIKIYRDPQLSSELSRMDWLSPLEVGLITRSLGEYADRNRWYSAPVHLWGKNVSPVAVPGVRVMMIPPTVDAPFVWVDASRDPDTVQWQSARQAPVLVTSGSVAAGASFSFWLRLVFDRIADDVNLHPKLALLAD